MLYSTPAGSAIIIVGVEVGCRRNTVGVRAVGVGLRMVTVGCTTVGSVGVNTTGLGAFFPNPPVDLAPAQLLNTRTRIDKINTFFTIASFLETTFY
jgi:hypothetical protein